MKNNIIEKSLSSLLENKNFEFANFSHPLLSNGYSKKDIIEGCKVMLSKKITMGSKTSKFEKYFAKKLKVKYALMVNSGSSANLLSFFCLINFLKKNMVKKNSECIIPALCWSTTLWPIIQSGLKPVFADVDLDTFCISYKSLLKKINKKTKVIIIVNVLGNCPDIFKIRALAKKKNIYLIEDNCESLGSKIRSKYLGTIGDFGTFSFYYSHQVTGGEGGMITCKSKEDYQILKSLRAHGWDREFFKKKVKDFNFINQGFNLRPLDVSAAIAFNQFKRLDKMIKIRSKNRNLIIKTLKSSTNWNNQFSFFQPKKKLKPSWFGFPIIINNSKIYDKKKYLEFLNKKKIETRPIISGNFANQSSVKLYRIKFKKNEFTNAQKIEDDGFFIGLPTTPLKIKDVKKLSNLLLSIELFK